MWLLEEAALFGSPPESVVKRLMSLNFAAIRTTSNVRLLSLRIQ